MPLKLLLIYYGSYLVFPLVLFFFYIQERQKGRAHILKNFFFFFCYIACTLFVYMRFVETQIISVNTTRIYADFNANIALIADPHIGVLKGKGFLERVVKKLNQQEVDFVLLAGDLTGYPNKKQLRDLFSPLQDLKVPLYWVLGNHDVEKPGPKLRDELIEAMDYEGVYFLNNQSVDFEGFTLIGLGSNWAGEDDISLLDQYDHTDNIIVLTHNPDTILKYRNKNADITFCGHTHGGQIKIPFLYKKFIPTIGDFDEGFTNEQNTNLFISSGLGEVGLPMRLFNPPTIDIIEMRKYILQ